MAKPKRPTRIGARMADFEFQLEDPDGNASVISSAGDADGEGEELAASAPKQAQGQAPAPAEEGEDEGIDWANVASEAAAMVELNKGATASWQGEQPEEEDR